MTNPKPINPYDFQEQLNRYTKDIVIVWNNSMERFQVCQALEPLIKIDTIDASMAEMRKAKLRPMFTVQYENGDYREPDESDLQRVIDSINSTITLQTKGYDHVADMMEQADIEREESIAPGVQDAMRWGAEEMYKIRTQKGILGFR